MALSIVHEEIGSSGEEECAMMKGVLLMKELLVQIDLSIIEPSLGRYGFFGIVASFRTAWCLALISCVVEYISCAAFLISIRACTLYPFSSSAIARLLWSIAAVMEAMVLKFQI